NEITLLRRDRQRLGESEFLGKLEARLRTVEQQTAMLSQLFERIAPFGGRKRGRPIETTLERIVADAFALFRGKIQDLGVQIELPDGETLVTVDPTEVQSILVNLVDNALYWLEKVPKLKRKIVVECKRLPKAVQLLFSDSGPGISKEVQDRIFEPYFST